MRLQVLSGDSHTQIPAVNRRRSNCQEGKGTDSSRRLVDGEAGWGVGIKKRGFTPSLLIPAQQSIFYYLIEIRPQGVVQGESALERCLLRCGRR